MNEMKENQETNKTETNKTKKPFRLSDEARAKIDMEYSDVSDSYYVQNPQLKQPPAPQKKQPTQRQKRQGTPKPVPRVQKTVRPKPRPRPQPRPVYAEPQYEEPIEEYGESPKNQKIKRFLLKLALRVIMICLIIMAVNVGVLFYSGKLWFNEPRKRDYPVRGPVVSESLGKVDWQKFAQQNIQMAYIRATKGTAYVDERFKKNQSGSALTDLPTGFLHIYDIGMDGAEQAEHFISAVGDMQGRLRPAVEVKESGFYRVLPVDRDKAKQNLRAFVDAVYEEYGVTPVIKCDKKTYVRLDCDESFDDCPIWYECEYTKPPEEVQWDLWGYSSRVKFNYYESGGFLEMVLYSGSEEDFEENMYV